MDFRSQIETAARARLTKAGYTETRPAPALSQSAGPTFEAPDIALDTTIVIGAAAGDRERSISQSLAGSRRKMSGTRPQLTPIDEADVHEDMCGIAGLSWEEAKAEMLGTRGKGAPPQGKKAGAVAPKDRMGLRDELDIFFEELAVAKAKGAHDKAHTADLEEENKELKAMVAALQAREKAQSDIESFFISLYMLLLLLLWARCVAGFGTWAADARQRWAGAAAVLRPCLPLVVLAPSLLWGLYTVAFPDMGTEELAARAAECQAEAEAEATRWMGLLLWLESVYPITAQIEGTAQSQAPATPAVQPQRQRRRPPVFEQAALARARPDGPSVAGHRALQADWAAQVPELTKGERPIRYKVLGLRRGEKDQEYVLYPFTLHLEGVKHKIELRWSVAKELHGLLVDARAHTCSSHLDTTAPCPFKGQRAFAQWCGGNVLKAAHAAVFDRFNPAMLLWRHAQVEALLRAVVADRELWEVPAVRITLDLDSLDRAIARQKTAHVAAAVRGAVVAAF